MRLDQPPLNRVEHQFRRAVQIQGFHEARTVDGHRVDADIQERGDLLV